MSYLLSKMNSWPINDTSKVKMEIVYGSVEYDWYHIP